MKYIWYSPQKSKYPLCISLQILTAHAECIDTFFVQWAVRCLPEDGKYKSVDISLPVDSNKVDAILSAFTSGTEINSR